MTVDQRLPALRAVRRQLQSDAEAARNIVDTAIANGKDATGLVMRQHEINAALIELDYVIEYHSDQRDNRVEVSRHTLIAATILYLFLMIPVLYLLFAANVGH